MGGEHAFDAYHWRYWKGEGFMQLPDDSLTALSQPSGAMFMQD